MTEKDRPAGVAVVGSINADLTVGAHHLPQPGETVLGETFALGLGGKGANQAVAAARAGAPTFLVGAVGDDLFRPLTLDALRADGVDVHGVAVLEGGTGVAHIRVDAVNGQNDIVVVPRANGQLTADYVADRLRALAGRVSVLLLQLEIPIDAVLAAAKLGREMGLLVVLDPAPAQPLPEEVWSLVDVVKPNESEAEVLTGTSTHDLSGAQEAAGWFLARGVGTAMVTLGARGVVVVRPGAVGHVPSPQVRAIDSTAAGDAFTGSLGAWLASGAPLEEAVRRAVATASVAVTRAGATASIPTAAEVDRFLLSAAAADSGSARG
jgi:ribokinase